MQATKNNIRRDLGIAILIGLGGALVLTAILTITFSAIYFALT